MNPCVHSTQTPRETPRPSILRGLRGLALCLACAAAPMPFVIAPAAAAQEFRATITGTVADSTGAAIPGAAITVTQVDTGAVNKTVSDGKGGYNVPFLPPGHYRIEASAPGFQSLVRNDITLQPGQRPAIDLALQIGSADQTVTVSAAAPLIDQSDASVGQVITTEQVENLPLNGRTPIQLTELSIGVIATGQPTQLRAFDNNAGNAWSIAGTPNQTSEILIDGIPDDTWSGALAYSPTQDTVSQVQVSIFDTDASFGHTIGGVLNQITKAGTNQIHGSAYYFGQVSALDANSYFNNRAGVPISVTHFNQYGLTVGGPIFIPKIYAGRDKLFFFFAWEGLKDSQPSTALNTVPTAAERTGDFSALLPQGCSSSSFNPSNPAVCSDGSANSYQLYNPYTATLNKKKQVVRQPIPNNNLTAAGLALSPVASNYLKYYPQPNTTGGSDGSQNYLSNAPSLDNYDNEFGRIDWNMSSRSHLFGDIRHNYRSQTKNDYFPTPSVGSGLTRENFGAEFDEIFTVNPTTVVDLRGGWTYFNEIHNAPSESLSPTSVGFPSALGSSSLFPQLPFVGFAGSCGSLASYQCLGDTGGAKVPSTAYQLFTDVVKTVGHHTLKFGVDLRQYRLDVANYGASSGSFTFGTNFVTAGSGAAAPKFGGDFASFLLGLPNSGSYFQSARASYHQWYAAGFVQDDWRATDHLTVNLGIRFDHDTPYEEKLGRTTNGFDPNASLPITASAQANYAAAPNAQLAAGAFNPVGGLTFPGSSNGAPYRTVSHYFSPRLGFSFSPPALHNTTLRGGFGMFVGPDGVSFLSSSGSYSSNPIANQEGFSSTTSFVSSTDNNLTPANTLDNPFPTGFTAVSGSSLGAATNLGQNITILAPVQKDPYSLRYSLGVQHAFGSKFLTEVAYIGNHSVHLPIGDTQLNPLPAQYLSTLPTRDQPLIDTLNASTPNPFVGLLPGTSLNGKTIPVAQLLTVHPQFPTSKQSFSQGILEQNASNGQSYFNSINARVENRFSHGLTLIGTYGFSKNIDATTYLNDTDQFVDRRISPYDHTHHFVVAAIYDLPFGRGRAYNINNRVVDALLGGFRVNGIYTYQTGAPIVFTSDIPLAPGATLKDITINNRNTAPADALKDNAGLNRAAFNLTSGGQFQYHLRTLPQSFSNVRADGINNLDASVVKDFSITESAKFQLRFETFNTLNHASFDAPNVSSPTSSSFGYITKQSNTSRQVQIGGRLTF